MVEPLSPPDTASWEHAPGFEETLQARRKIRLIWIKAHEVCERFHQKCATFGEDTAFLNNGSLCNGKLGQAYLELPQSARRSAGIAA